MVADATGVVPFSVLDEVVHLLDTDAEPWTIELELALDGHLDEDRLRAAVRAALARHPMARARARPARRTDTGWSWELPGATDVDLDPLTVVSCPDGPSLDAARAGLYSRPLPVVQSPPVRIRLARREGGDLLLLAANHAAFDGFGGLRLLHSVARAYAGRPDPPPSADLWQARRALDDLAGAGPAERWARYRALASKLGDLARPPARLAPEGGADRPGYGVCHLDFPLPAPPAGGTVNDLLLVALHLAVAGWNAEHGARPGRVGVLVPVNLRPRPWRADVVDNHVLESRVATTAADRVTPAACLRAVADQTRRIKQGRGAALMEVLPRGRRLPLWAKQALSPLMWLTGNRLVDTAVLSNLGAVAELPSFAPEGPSPRGLWFSAPARMPCGLSLGAAGVGGRLHLSFRYRHPLWSREAAARFAERYRVELGVASRECGARG